MIDKAISMLIEQANKITRKNQFNIETWDVSDHLTLCVDLQKETAYYRTKPGGTAIEDRVTQDDIFIVASAIKFSLSNPLDRFTTETDIYNRFAVLFFAKQALFAGKDHYKDHFFIKEGHLFFKQRSGHFVYLPKEDSGIWYQLKMDTSLSKLKLINQINPRRDKEMLEILRTHVLWLRKN